MKATILRLWLLLLLANACDASSPSDANDRLDDAGGGGGGIVEACGAPCPIEQFCSLTCEGAGVKIGCNTPPPGAVGLGEACQGRMCREGMCAVRAGSVAVCIEFCKVDADCDASETCQTRDIVYTCPTTRVRFETAVCLPKPS